jgi:hypothetical protein
MEQKNCPKLGAAILPISCKILFQKTSKNITKQLFPYFRLFCIHNTADSPCLLVCASRLLFPHGKNIAGIFVHCNIGPSLFCGHFCAGTWSRSQLTTSALKKGLQMVDDLVDHFFEIDHFMDRCLKFKCEMEAVMALYKEVY